MKDIWRTENKSLIVDAEVLDLIIPSEYFEHPSIAEDYGTEVSTFCFIIVRTWKNNKVNKIAFLRLPGRMTFSYAEKFIENASGYDGLDGDNIEEIVTDETTDLSDKDENTIIDTDKVEDIKTSKIEADTIEDQVTQQQQSSEQPTNMDIGDSLDEEELNSNFIVFRNYKDTILTNNIYIVQSVDNMFELSKAISSGKLGNIAYKDLPLLYIIAAKLNNVNAGITNSLNEIMISELVRWKKDLTIPLRLAMAKGKAKETDGVLCKLKDLPRLNSVFTGIGFENIVYSSQVAVAKTNRKVTQRKSPVEEVLKY